MEGFDPKTSFGHEVSLRYDDEDTRGDEDETVAFLARLAGRREALELAVGTGRIALPLTRAGVRVDGIEMSQHMVDRMGEKPGGAEVDVTIGDMSQVSTGMTVDQLSTTFSALADPTRRAILAQLAEGEATVNELAEPFPITLQAVSKHLKVLERAGLIARGRSAQLRPSRLQGEALREAFDWLSAYRDFWGGSFDRLGEHLREIQKGPTHD